MDSVTHIALGACIGEVLLGHKIGKKALLLGAFAQSIPDFDFISSSWLSSAEELLAHRGLTHSLFFVLIIAPLAGIILHSSFRRTVSVPDFSSFFLIEMLVHLFLDAFNNYGVGWFEPFKSTRVSFNTVYVADIIMTSVPLLAFVVLLVISAKSIYRRRWARTAIIWTTAYLCLCIFIKIYIDAEVKKAFAIEKIHYERYFTTPAPLQNLLWMAVAGDSRGYYVGYRSVFDTDPAINFNYFPVNENLLEPVSDHKDVALLKRFSQGFYTVVQSGDTLVFNDLRFGQIIGWHDPKEKFVFHYFLRHPENNTLVVQRGRFSKWNRQSIISFIRRIKGN